MSRQSKLNLKAVRASLAAHLTIAAAAETLGVHERTLRRWLEANPQLVATRQASLKRATRKLSKDT